MTPAARRVCVLALASELEPHDGRRSRLTERLDDLADSQVDVDLVVIDGFGPLARNDRGLSVHHLDGPVAADDFDAGVSVGRVVAGLPRPDVLEVPLGWRPWPIVAASTGAPLSGRSIEGRPDDHSHPMAALARARLAAPIEAPARRPMRGGPNRTVHHVMEALDLHDGVSEIARDDASILRSLGHGGPVLARLSHASLEAEVAPLSAALARPGALILHWWGCQAAAWMLAASAGPTAIRYHNITPPELLFDGGLRSTTRAGRRQLAALGSKIDLIVGVSQFNNRELVDLLGVPKATLAVPPVVRAESWRQMADDPRTSELLQAQHRAGDEHLLFVGRMAGNKRQDDLVAAFEHYCAEVNPRARLWLAGNPVADPPFAARVAALVERSRWRQRIHIVGMVSAAELVSLHRHADVFVSASRHEGFCLPIAHSMAAGVPVVALAAAAVPETMGAGGVALERWSSHAAVEAIARLQVDDDHRRAVVAAQELALEPFSIERVTRRWAQVIDVLLDGGRPADLVVIEPSR